MQPSVVPKCFQEVLILFGVSSRVFACSFYATYLKFNYVLLRRLLTTLGSCFIFDNSFLWSKS